MSRRKHILFLVLALLIASTGAARAQVPKAVAPGAVEKEFRPNYAPLSQQGFALPESTPDATPEWSKDIRLVLKRLDIRGAETYAEDDLLPLYADMQGKEIRLSAVYEVAQEITRKYAADGYPLSFAIVPAQEIDNGVVRIQVAEGYISEVTLAGEVSKSRLKLINALKDELTATRPLSIHALERSLLLLNDLPGLTVRAVFERVTGAFGATRLNLIIEEDKAEGRLTLDNRGSKAFGRGRAHVEGTLNSPLGFNESFKLSAITTRDTDEMNYLSSDIGLPVGLKGTVLNLQASASDTEPGLPNLQAVDFRSKGVTARAQLRHPFIRTRSRNLFGTAAVERNAFKSKTIAGISSDDTLWVVSAGLDWDEYRGAAQNFLSAGVRQGLGIFGATTARSANRSDVGGDGTFTSLQLQGGSLLTLPGTFSVFLTGKGQWAARGLLSSEQCGYGGAQFGKGYDNFEISGDHCLQGAAELRSTHYNVGMLDQVQPYAVADAGSVWQTGRLTAGERKQESRKSLGIGTRFVYKAAQGYVEVSKPLGQDVSLEQSDDPRFFAELAWGF